MLFIFSISFYGCFETNDPLGNLNLGYQTKEELTTQLLNDSLIIEKASTNFFDAINKYKYNLENRDFKYEFSVHFDNEIYDFGKSRSIRLNFDSATQKEKDEIVSIYSNWYGKPIEDSNGNLNWKSDKFNISYYERKIEDYKSYNIKYVNLKFEERNNQVKDSIEQNQTIDKLVLFNETNCVWEKLSSTNRNFWFKIRISRKEKFDFRMINSIRLNFIIHDEFGEELFRDNDITIELNTPMAPLRERIDYDPYYTIPSNDMDYNLKYSIYDTEYHALEKARIYSLRHKIFCKGEITKVALDDGTILSK